MTGKGAGSSGTLKAALWMAGSACGLFALSLAPLAAGLRYRTELPILLPMLLFLLSLMALLKSLFARTERGFFLRALYALLAGVLTVVGGMAAVGYLAFGTRLSDTRVEASPSGKRRLVIIENGSLDANYRAYPMVNAWMYRAEDNGSIAYIGFWADVDAPAVEWVSDAEARVRLDAGAILKKGCTDEIVVRFDSP